MFLNLNVDRTESLFFLFEVIFKFSFKNFFNLVDIDILKFNFSREGIFFKFLNDIFKFSERILLKKLVSSFFVNFIF